MFLVGVDGDWNLVVMMVDYVVYQNVVDLVMVGFVNLFVGFEVIGVFWVQGQGDYSVMFDVDYLLVFVVMCSQMQVDLGMGMILWLIFGLLLDGVVIYQDQFCEIQ